LSATTAGPDTNPESATPAATDPQPAPGATPPRVPLTRRAASECVGTAALVAVVIGSGIQATELSKDVGVQLLANSLATVFGLGVLILLLGPVSGAHFNPVVTLAEWWTARHGGPGVTLREAAAYIPAQVAGAIGGAVLANAMFGQHLVTWSTHDRSAGHLLLAKRLGGLPCGEGRRRGERRGQRGGQPAVVSIRPIAASTEGATR
jgi:hypothetical protein